MKTHKYRQLEQHLRDEIYSGQRKMGERMPSIKSLCAEKKVSKSTVINAYTRLEADGFIAARPRSGYYVVYSNETQLKAPSPSSPVSKPVFASAAQVFVDIMEQGAAFDILPKNNDLNSNESLKRCLSRANRQSSGKNLYYYDEPMGVESLREQLAQRIGYGGGSVRSDEVMITSGCQHALLLALMACTSRGDVVAVESPGFYGVLELLELLGLQVIELPCSAETGLSPEALSLALEHWEIKALIVTPNFATPTGAQMPEKNKLEIIEIAHKHNMTIIEDDIYGELMFDMQRPRTLLSYDSYDIVIYCSSFSKSLSRDLRLGCIVTANFMKEVKRLKLITVLSSSVALQRGVSAFLEEGGYDRHLRIFRQTLKHQCHELLSLIPTLIPNYISCSQPKGGLALWLELPTNVYTLDLYIKAREEGIIIAPGRLFTAQDRYNNFLRISFLHAWDESRKSALKRLGEMIRDWQ